MAPAKHPPALTPLQKYRYAEDLVDRLDLRITVDELTKALARLPARATLRRTLAQYPTRPTLRLMLYDCATQEEREELWQTIRERKELMDLLKERIVTEAALADAKDRLKADKPLTKAELKILREYEATSFRYQPPPPTVPTLIEPGPAKVAVLEHRAAAGLGLWLKGEDAELSTDDGCEYDPVCAEGNGTVTGRRPRTPKTQLPGRGKWRERLSDDLADW